MEATFYVHGTYSFCGWKLLFLWMEATFYVPTLFVDGSYFCVDPIACASFVRQAKQEDKEVNLTIVYIRNDVLHYIS